METPDAPDGGYDVAFIGELPDFLECPICFLVLRDPVLIVSCGHKMCLPCFQRMTESVNSMKQELRCPEDREPIAPCNVVPENGLKRVIESLSVKCCSNVLGCPWEGELRVL